MAGHWSPGYYSSMGSSPLGGGLGSSGYGSGSRNTQSQFASAYNAPYMPSSMYGGGSTTSYSKPTERGSYSSMGMSGQGRYGATQPSSTDNYANSLGLSKDCAAFLTQASSNTASGGGSKPPAGGSWSSDRNTSSASKASAVSNGLSPQNSSYELGPSGAAARRGSLMPTESTPSSKFSLDKDSDSRVHQSSGDQLPSSPPASGQPRAKLGELEIIKTLISDDPLGLKAQVGRNGFLPSAAALCVDPTVLARMNDELVTLKRTEDSATASQFPFLTKLMKDIDVGEAERRRKLAAARKSYDFQTLTVAYSFYLPIRHSRSGCEMKVPPPPKRFVCDPFHCIEKVIAITTLIEENVLMQCEFSDTGQTDIVDIDVTQNNAETHPCIDDVMLENSQNFDAGTKFVMCDLGGRCRNAAAHRSLVIPVNYPGDIALSLAEFCEENAETSFVCDNVSSCDPDSESRTVSVDAVIPDLNPITVAVELNATLREVPDELPEVSTGVDISCEQMTGENSIGCKNRSVEATIPDLNPISIVVELTDVLKEVVVEIPEAFAGIDISCERPACGHSFGCSAVVQLSEYEVAPVCNVREPPPRLETMDEAAVFTCSAPPAVGTSFTVVLRTTLVLPEPVVFVEPFTPPEECSVTAHFGQTSSLTHRMPISPNIHHHHQQPVSLPNVLPEEDCMPGCHESIVVVIPLPAKTSMSISATFEPTTSRLDRILAKVTAGRPSEVATDHLIRRELVRCLSPSIAPPKQSPAFKIIVDETDCTLVGGRVPRPRYRLGQHIRRNRAEEDDDQVFLRVGVRSDASPSTDANNDPFIMQKKRPTAVADPSPTRDTPEFIAIQKKLLRQITVTRRGSTSRHRAGTPSRSTRFRGSGTNTECAPIGASSVFSRVILQPPPAPMSPYSAAATAAAARNGQTPVRDVVSNVRVSSCLFSANFNRPYGNPNTYSSNASTYGTAFTNNHNNNNNNNRNNQYSAPYSSYTEQPDYSRGPAGLFGVQLRRVERRSEGRVAKMSSVGHHHGSGGGGLHRNFGSNSSLASIGKSSRPKFVPRWRR